MRIRLKPLEEYLFETTVKIRITDLNYGNHMGNQMVLSYAQEARAAFFQALGGWGELDIGGKGVIMGDAAVVYQSEGKGGEVLEILVGIDDITRVSFDLHYQIVESKTQRPVALIKTGMVFMDYEVGKVTTIPSVFLEQLEILKEKVATFSKKS